VDAVIMGMIVCVILRVILRLIVRAFLRAVLREVVRGIMSVIMRALVRIAAGGVLLADPITAPALRPHQKYNRFNRLDGTTRKASLGRLYRVTNTGNFFRRRTE
jgi:hypothetical protein